LILLFTNDKIYEKNNIEKILKILDENQTISLCISALIKKEKNERKLKKNILMTLYFVIQKVFQMILFAEDYFHLELLNQ